MNVSEFCCIALGMLFNVLTFVLGVAVGVNVSRKRKDSPNDNRYENEGFRYYGDHASPDAARGVGGGFQGGGRGKVTEARAAKRAYW